MSAGTHTLITGDADAMLRALPVDPGRIRSRRIFAGPGATMVRLSLAAGETLREHIATTPLVLQVLSGHSAMDVGRERVDLPTGAIIHLDANVAHEVEALSESQLLLILFDTDRVDPGATPDARVRRPRSVPRPVRRVRARSLQAVLALDGADAIALDQLTAIHAALSGKLADHTARLLDAAADEEGQRLADVKEEFLDWCHGALTDLLDSEGAVIPAALRRVDPGLAGRLEQEREDIDLAITGLAEQQEAVAIAASAVELRVRIGHHLRSHDDEVVPILAGTPGVSLNGLWREVRTRLERLTGAERTSTHRPR